MRVARQLASFDKLMFRGPGELKITQCDQESLSITAPDYVLDNIVSVVAGGELNLGYRDNRVINLCVYREEIIYDLRLKDLKQLTLIGNGKIDIPDLDNDQFKIILKGSGEIHMGHLTADDLKIDSSGSGSIHIGGDVEMQTITLTGSGSFMGENLVSDFAYVAIMGSGLVKLSVSEHLSVKITGSGHVSYTGFPEVEKLISGSGTLKRNRIVKSQLNRGNNHG